tara:strand:- start:867 stop:1310 length:444 start_codon:yes stop_codon:yes gene_type:complete
MKKKIIIFNDSKIVESIKINPKNIVETIKILKTLKQHPIEVYDITYNLQKPHNEQIIVKDHINQTGNNPLIGIQNQFSEPFIDISNTYNVDDGTTTVCLGPHYDQHKDQYAFPSTYLCYISILAKAIGVKKINATLINKIDSKNYQL